MICRINDLKDKEIICVSDGTRVGFVCDAEINCTDAKFTALVVYGKAKLFGLFGREEDFVIPWEHIVVIGSDTILVNYKPLQKSKKSTGILSNIFEMK
ncbi:MAG: YlmC/YmxH family sporulation protein [Clostridia bacterium]